MYWSLIIRDVHPFPTRRSSDLRGRAAPLRGALPARRRRLERGPVGLGPGERPAVPVAARAGDPLDDADRAAAAAPLLDRAHRSEEHTSELQSRRDLVCRLLLEK